MHEIRIERRGAIPIAYVRHVGPYDDPSLPGVFERIVRWAADKGLMDPGMRLFGIGHDDPSVTPAEELRFDAAVSVPEGTPADGDVRVSSLPGGEYAVATHVGPYEALAETYEALSGWVREHGREPADSPQLEEYLDGPEVPEHLRRTLVAIRLA